MIEKEKQLLNAAAGLHGCDWRALLAWKVTPEQVIIVIPDGRKFKYAVDELRAAVSAPAEQPEAEAAPAAKPSSRKRTAKK